MSEVLNRRAEQDLNGLELHRETGTQRLPAPSGEGRLHRVTAVGGGAAGLVTRLGRRSRSPTTLIESARTHLWKPLLHASILEQAPIDWNH